MFSFAGRFIKMSNSFDADSASKQRENIVNFLKSPV